MNLWKPTNAGEQLPVIVFVHGGSNRGGWSYEPDYEGIELATYGAIVVTIAYRLGVFGFFTHPDLSLSNFALTDIVAALDWLQRHVAAFGGDPHNITLMGESAGGNNILHLLSSPIAKGRFQRAIVQSAGWAISGRTNRFEQLQLASELTEELSLSVKGLRVYEQLLRRKCGLLRKFLRITFLMWWLMERRSSSQPVRLCAMAG